MKSFLNFEDSRKLLVFLIFSIILIYLPLLSGGRENIAAVITFILAFPLAYFASRLNVQKIKNPFYKSLPAALFVFIGLALLSSLFSLNYYESLFWSFWWITGLIIFMSFIWFASSFKEIGKIFLVIVFSALILSFIGIYFFLNTQNIASIRMFSTFYSHNAFGAFLLFPLFISLSYLGFSQNKKQIYVFGAITAVLFSSLILTFSRASWLSFIAAFLIIALLFRKNLDKRFFLRAGVVFVLGLILAFSIFQIKSQLSGPAEQSPQIYSYENIKENAVLARLQYFKDAIKIFKKNPATGVGFYAYSEAIGEHQTDIKYFSSDPHNLYLRTASELGIAGILALAWITGLALYLIIKVALKKAVATQEKIINFAAASATLAMLGHNGADANLRFPANLILLFIALAALYKIKNMDNIEKSDRPRRSVMKLIFSAISFVVLLAGLILFVSNSHFENALYLSGQNNQAEAILSLKTAIKFNPINPDYHGVLAETYYNNGELDEALIELNKALSIAPHKSFLHFLKAEIYKQKQEKNLQEKELKLAIKYSHINNVNAYTELTNLYIKQQKYDEAISLLDNLLSYYPPEVFSSTFWTAPNKEQIKTQIKQLEQLKIFLENQNEA